MKRRLVVPISVTVLCFIFLGSCLAALSVRAAPGAASADRSWIDTFDSTSLDARWSWVREDPTHWSLTSNPGFMHIVTQQGGFIGPGGTVQNVLLTAAPVGAYQITTKVTISPTENFQSAGIIVYQDDDNYIKIARRYGNGNKITLRKEVNADLETIEVPETATTVYLRIARITDSYTGLYSTDGSVWILLGVYDQALNNPEVGICSEGGTSLIEIPSDYDFFQLVDYAIYLSLPVIFKN